MRAETEEVIVPLGNEFKPIFETVFQNFIGTYIVATWSDPLFFFYFLFCLGKEIGQRKQVLCRIFISKIETRPYQGSLWSECINGSSHISSELFLGILNHKYESHYCVWVELLYGLRFVGLTWLVMKRMFKGWEGGSHEALPVLRPNSKERNTQDWAGMGGWEVFLKLAVWLGSKKMKSKIRFSRNIAESAADHASLEQKRL